MHKLTKRQNEALLIIEKYIKSNGYAPTYRDIGQLMSLKSTSTVSGYLNQLRLKGYVDWIEGQPRTLHIIEQQKSSVS